MLKAKGLGRAGGLQGSGGSLVPPGRAGCTATAGEMLVCRMEQKSVILVPGKMPCMCLGGGGGPQVAGHWEVASPAPLTPAWQPWPSSARLGKGRTQHSIASSTVPKPPFPPKNPKQWVSSRKQKPQPCARAINQFSLCRVCHRQGKRCRARRGVGAGLPSLSQRARRLGYTRLVTPCLAHHRLLGCHQLCWATFRGCPHSEPGSVLLTAGRGEKRRRSGHLLHHRAATAPKCRSPNVEVPRAPRPTAAHAQAGAVSAVRRDAASARGADVTTAPATASGECTGASARARVLLHTRCEGRYCIAPPHCCQPSSPPAHPISTPAHPDRPTPRQMYAPIDAHPYRCTPLHPP